MAGDKRVPIGDRFWSKVDIRGPDDCWPWLRFIGIGGYGKICRGGGGNGHMPAHRVAWELTNGPIPDGMCVCHRCDNRPCCNPDHLFLGTKADNTEDMMRKGRHAGPRSGVRGEGHPGAKLTSADVIAIRATNGKHRDIAAKFGVSRPTVSQIKQGRTWRSV